MELELRYMILGEHFPPGHSARAMTHRILGPNQWEPAGMEQVTNATNMWLAAGSRVHVVSDGNGDEWFVSALEMVHQAQVVEDAQYGHAGVVPTE